MKWISCVLNASRCLSSLQCLQWPVRIFRCVLCALRAYERCIKWQPQNSGTRKTRSGHERCEKHCCWGRYSVPPSHQRNFSCSMCTERAMQSGETGPIAIDVRFILVMLWPRYQREIMETFLSFQHNFQLCCCWCCGRCCLSASLPLSLRSCSIVASTREVLSLNHVNILFIRPIRDLTNRIFYCFTLKIQEKVFDWM